jgi:hypothetical protein
VSARLKIEQSLLMGLGQDAQGTGDEQVPAFGFGAPFPLVDQEAVGIERQRECDPGSRNWRAGSEGGSGRISHWSGGCAIQVRTASGVSACCNSPATVCGTSTLV